MRFSVSILAASLSLLSASSLIAATTLPSVFGDHMVLQRDQACPIWGWDDPGQKVTVQFADQTHSTQANENGRWQVALEPMPASAIARDLSVEGSSQHVLRDILIGEVWVCAGQSNMAWPLERVTDGDVYALSASEPGVRLLRVPARGVQEPQDDFKGAWDRLSPESAKNFSAIGLHYGRELHRILGVPVGLISNAWGGSAAETWIRREALLAEPTFAGLMKKADRWYAYQASPEGRADYETKIAELDSAIAEAKAAGRTPPRQPRDPDWWLNSNKRPANGFGGSLHPILGYSIRGVIWYQGEANTAKAAGYRDLFPFLISEWRREWGQGDFPFYWVQLADYHAEKPEPGEGSWAELREAQTLAQALPNTAQAVITDLGEGSNIHPRQKQLVASRLLRLALHHDYGFTDLPYRSPEYDSQVIENGRISVTLDCFGSSLRTLDTNEVLGFAICGADRVWHWAQAKITAPNQVEVWSDDLTDPIAVRYAWADNPVCNLYSTDDLPVTPFRTDDFPLTTPVD